MNLKQNKKHTFDVLSNWRLLRVAFIVQLHQANDANVSTDLHCSLFSALCSNAANQARLLEPSCVDLQD